MNAEAFRNHLENDIIPFWNKFEDEKNGGFYGYGGGGYGLLQRFQKSARAHRFSQNFRERL